MEHINSRFAQKAAEKHRDRIARIQDFLAARFDIDYYTAEMVATEILEILEELKND